MDEKRAAAIFQATIIDNAVIVNIVNILLVQLGFLGDCILSTHLPDAIKQHHSGAIVSVLTTPGATVFFKYNSSVDRVIPFAKRGKQKGLRGIWNLAQELKKYKFDVAYSLHRSLRTSLVLALADIPYRVGFKSAKGAFLYTELKTRPVGEHDVIRNLSILGDNSVTKNLTTNLTLVIPPESSVSAEVKSWCQGNSPYVSIFPSSVWATKRWHKEGFRSIVSNLITKGYRVCIMGAPNERNNNSFVAEGFPDDAVRDFTGVTSMDETVWMVSRARLVVCNDSMALHIGSALKIPTVTIFCATSPWFGFGPWQNQALVVQHEALDCKPCKRHGSIACPTGTELCMKGVAPKDVMTAVMRLLEETPPFLSQGTSTQYHLSP
jgi:heptosyltransferase-2